MNTAALKCLSNVFLKARVHISVGETPRGRMGQGVHLPL